MNDFSGSKPKNSLTNCLTKCQIIGLVFLNLSHNSIVNLELFQFNRLVEVDLSYNRLITIDNGDNKILPESLDKLFLSNNQKFMFDGSVIECLKNKVLDVLDISKTIVSKPQLESLAGKVTHLIHDYNEIIDKKIAKLNDDIKIALLNNRPQK